MPIALVTGVAGQDGGYLAEELLGSGYDVHGVVRGSDVHDQPWLAGVTLHEMDVGDAEALTSLVTRVRPDELYHLAALSSVARSWAEPVESALVNAVPVAHLLDSMWSLHEEGHRASFVQASSAELFGDAEVWPQDESTPVRPTSPYGAAKAFAHHLVGVYRARGLRASTCILYNHESPRRPEAFVTRKITAAAARIAAGRQDGLRLGTLSVRRDWGWAPDYAHAMALAGRHAEPGDWVVATGADHTIQDFVEVAFARVGLDWRRYVTTDAELVRPTDAGRQVGDAGRARSELGWTPTKDFRQVVEAMVDADVALVASAGSETR